MPDLPLGPAACTTMLQKLQQLNGNAAVLYVDDALREKVHMSRSNIASVTVCYDMVIDFWPNMNAALPRWCGEWLMLKVVLPDDCYVCLRPELQLYHSSDLLLDHHHHHQSHHQSCLLQP